MTDEQRMMVQSSPEYRDMVWLLWQDELDKAGVPR